MDSFECQNNAVLSGICAHVINLFALLRTDFVSKKEGKYQESIQSSITSD